MQMLFLAAVLALVAVPDAMRTPELKNVRLLGEPAKKMHDLFRERLTGEFAKKYVFAEARRAFEDRDDDKKGFGGLWRGEFWGKQMLSAARVADYLNDPKYTQWIQDECHRLIALQDPDGYLGSYRDKELVRIDNLQKATENYGFGSVWNIWNRKYAIWAMLAAYKTTGDRAILVSAESQAKQLIDMLHRRGIRLFDTGAVGKFGLPSMSIVKPMVLLYETTSDRKYLDFVAETLKDWDREDGACPNLVRNAMKPLSLHEWYPEPGKWAKTYEFLSCVDGLVEYYRATGERRYLDVAVAIRDNLARTNGNVFGGVGVGDQLLGAPLYCNAVNEVCDLIHWIRLNVDLFLVSGETKYLDAAEIAYFNGYLAGIWRGGAWGPFFIRGHQRHTDQRQCGLAYNHCCVNNLPRTFMDMASVAVTRDAAGVFHVNLYQDASIELDDVRFDISGNYPVGNVVTVKVSGEAKVEFRHPAWCLKMDITEKDGVHTLVFDMNTRVVDRLETVPALNAKDMQCWAFAHYADSGAVPQTEDLVEGYRTTPAACVMHGPLLLAKSRLAGDTEDEVFAETGVNGKGYSVTVTPLPPNGYTWGRWMLKLNKPGEKPVCVKVCDFGSAGDIPAKDLFSVWF